MQARHVSGYTASRCSRSSSDAERPRSGSRKGGTVALFAFLLLSVTNSFLSCNDPGGKATGLFEASVLYSQVEAAILRTDPTTYGFEVDVIRKGESVRVLGRTEKKVRVGQNEDYWYFVQKENNLKGWVYGAALSRIPTGESEQAVEGPDLVVVQANLPGIWWELNQDGSTGYRRLEFIPDGSQEKKSEEKEKDEVSIPGVEEQKEVILAENGKFQYFFGKNPGAIIPYQIDPKTRRIRLTQDSPVGQEFEILDLGEEFRLISAKGDKKFSFKKGYETEEEKEKEKESEAKAPAEEEKP